MELQPARKLLKPEEQARVDAIDAFMKETWRRDYNVRVAMFDNSLDIKDRFMLRCLFCESVDVKVHIRLDSINCYYPGDDPDVVAIVKCYGCGEAVATKDQK